MSISQLENKIKSLQTEIERLGRALEAESKNEAKYNTSLKRTVNSITKHTSPSMLKSKQRSIDSDTEKQLEIKRWGPMDIFRVLHFFVTFLCCF